MTGTRSETVYRKLLADSVGLATRVGRAPG
jgi:hypothetical protein